MLVSPGQQEGLQTLPPSRSAACRQGLHLPAPSMAQQIGTMRLIGVHETMAQCLLCDVQRHIHGWRRHAARSSKKKFCSVTRMEFSWNRNMTTAAEVVAAASARGALPELQALLVEPSWREALAAEFAKPNAKQLQRHLHREWAEQKVFPPQAEVFRWHSICLLRMPAQRCCSSSKVYRPQMVLASVTTLSAAAGQ